jgi:hypothetical protein
MGGLAYRHLQADRIPMHVVEAGWGFPVPIDPVADPL